MKIRPMGAELFHADRRTDGQTDMTKLIAVFLQLFRKRLKIINFYYTYYAGRDQIWRHIYSAPKPVH
jgi:hypothetical protein